MEQEQTINNVTGQEDGLKEILFIESRGLITYSKEIIIGDGERVFTSFIGKQPANTIVSPTAKVWEVIRCGARYHHDGKCENITKENAVAFFCDFYDLEIKSGDIVELWKRVRDDFTDFFSGTYEYLPGEKVTATDWIPNDRIVCGNGLHLAPTKELSELWNEGGRLLKCEVARKDMCIFPYNITQVRCRHR